MFDFAQNGWTDGFCLLDPKHLDNQEYMLWYKKGWNKAERDFVENMKHESNYIGSNDSHFDCAYC